MQDRKTFKQCKTENGFCEFPCLEMKKILFSLFNCFCPSIQNRNNPRKLCLTPTELLELAECMHSSYCNATGVLLKRLGLMKHIPSEMLNLLYHVHLYTTAYYVLPNEPSGKQNHWKNEIFAYSLSCCRHHFHLLLLTQLVFFSYSWYTWNCVFWFVQPLVFLLL